jgi:hypothetical protein
MRLSPARYLIDTINMPAWLVTILLIPLYPVNLVLTIKTVSSIFEGDSIRRGIYKILLIDLSFLLLPCLLLSEDDEE